MNARSLSWLKALGLGFILLWAAVARAQVPDTGELQLVTNAPVFGTFFLLSEAPSAPYPFDPSFGQLPLYEWNGFYFLDDTQSPGRGRSAMFSGSPPDPGGDPVTNAVCTNCFCNSPTNFTVSYASSSGGLWLGTSLETNNVLHFTVHTPDTNAPLWLFATTNMTKCVPGLNQTNWIWLMPLTNGPISFSWGQTNWCEAYFQMASLWDTDGDGMPDAWEVLVGHTDPFSPDDTDGDGIPDGYDPSPSTPAAIPTLVGRSIGKCPVNY